MIINGFRSLTIPNCNLVIVKVNYASQFFSDLLYSDPNKEFMGHQTKKIPVHWPEYTYDSKLYLHVGKK